MREIKFRAWDKTEKRMLYGEELYETGSDYIGIDAESGKFFRYAGYGRDEIYREELEHLLPLQYTNLKDKNGKEIYEGDIIRS